MARPTASRDNLFIDHSQIIQLEAPRAGIWGKKSLWGRVVTYKGESLRRLLEKLGVSEDDIGTEEFAGV